MCDREGGGVDLLKTVTKVVTNKVCKDLENSIMMNKHANVLLH